MKVRDAVAWPYSKATALRAILLKPPLLVEGIQSLVFQYFASKIGVSSTGPVEGVKCLDFHGN